MAVNSAIAYELSRATSMAPELCKMALERSKNNVIDAQRMLERWEEYKAPSGNNQGVFGVVYAYFAKQYGAAAIVDVRCNDELFTQSREFREFVGNVAAEVAEREDPCISNASIPGLEAKHNCKLNINSTRIVKSGEFSLLTTYTHRERIGVIVETEVDHSEAFANKKFRLFSFDCALHIAAFNPIAINKESIPYDLRRQTEKQIEKQLMHDGKDMRMWQTIIDGKISKWAEQKSLLHQVWIKSDRDTVGEARKKVMDSIGSDITIKRFSRFELGR